MAARNVLAARGRGRLSFAMLIQILQTRKAIRESRARRRARLAEIEAQTTGQIGARGGQTIRQIGGAGAQTRANVGRIQAQSQLTQANARTNMLNSLLGRGGTADWLISNWPQRGAPAGGVGGAGFPVSGGNVLGPRVTP